MKNNLFSRLTIPQQADMLFKEGCYLNTRQEPGFFVDMYLLNDLFVEIYFLRKQEDFVVVKGFYPTEDAQSNSTTENNIFYPLHLGGRTSNFAC